MSLEEQGTGAEDGAALRLEGGSLSWMTGTIDSGTGSNGVMNLTDSAATLIDVTWIRGTATSGGGLFVDGGTVSIEGCAFVANSAEQGGGIWASGATLVLDTVTVEQNTANVEAGGWFLRH